MDESPIAEPTPDERRVAVARAMTRAPGLVRYAARFSIAVEDAEDAYQRAMEIALTRAPVTEAAAFTQWIHTVVRREAVAIRERRRRDAPLPEDDDADTALRDGAPPPDAVAEWRERYRAIQDAMNGLTGHQRACLMLYSAGVTYEEIRRATGFSDRKIRRSISEGRTLLHSWEEALISGRQCASVRELLDRVIEGRASARERRSVDRHCRHCAACRTRYRVRQDQLRLLGAFVPASLAGVSLVGERPPDAQVLVGWWERASAGAGLRTAQLAQLVADLPALAATRAGAGAVAALAAAAVGAPLVIGGADAPSAGRRAPDARVSVTHSPPTPIPPPAAAPATPPASTKPTPAAPAPAGREPTTTPAGSPPERPADGRAALTARATGGRATRSAAAEFAP
jgi:RNA polymerase sigma factor (sigma-70 family)